MTGAVVRVTVPVRFYDDHRDRDLPSGSEISRAGNLVIVDLDAEALRDLRADAEFYVDMGVGEFGPEFLGLISSARATIRRLTGITIPDDMADFQS